MNQPGRVVRVVQVLPLMKQPKQQRIMELEVQLEKERKEHKETKEQLEILDHRKFLLEINVKHLLAQREKLREQVQQAEGRETFLNEELERVNKECEEKDKEMAEMKIEFAKGYLRIQTDAKKEVDILENKMKIAHDELAQMTKNMEDQSKTHKDHLAQMKETNRYLEQNVHELNDQLDKFMKDNKAIEEFDNDVYNLEEWDFVERKQLDEQSEKMENELKEMIQGLEEVGFGAIGNVSENETNKAPAGQSKSSNDEAFGEFVGGPIPQPFVHSEMAMFKPSYDSGFGLRASSFYATGTATCEFIGDIFCTSGKRENL